MAKLKSRKEKVAMSLKEKEAIHNRKEAIYNRMKELNRCFHNKEDYPFCVGLVISCISLVVNFFPYFFFYTEVINNLPKIYFIISISLTVAPLVLGGMVTGILLLLTKREENLREELNIVDYRTLCKICGGKLEYILESCDVPNPNVGTPITKTIYFGGKSYTEYEDPPARIRVTSGRYECKKCHWRTGCQRW